MCKTVTVYPDISSRDQGEVPENSSVRDFLVSLNAKKAVEIKFLCVKAGGPQEPTKEQSLFITLVRFDNDYKRFRQAGLVFVTQDDHTT